MDEVFFNPSVSNSGLNKVLFKWRIRPSFKYRRSGEKMRFLFMVDGKRHDVGSTSDLSIDEFEVFLDSSIDTTKECFAMIVYESNGSSYLSEMLPLGRYPNQKTSELVKRTMDTYVKSWVKAGFLLKGVLYSRMESGDICSYCLDGASNVHVDGSCPVCFGTTFVGGYHSYDFDVKMLQDIIGNTEATISKFSSDDTFDVISFEFTGPLLMLANSGDVWKDSQTGLMYMIDKTQVSKAIAGYPIKVAVVAHELSRNSVEYNIGGVEVERLD